MNALLTALEPVGAAVVFSIVWFVRSQDNDVSREDWDWYKFGATFAVGLVVALGIYQSSADLTMATFETRMAMYTGYVVILQGAIQSALRTVRPHFRAILYGQGPPDEDQDQTQDEDQNQSQVPAWRYSGPETGAGLWAVDPDRYRSEEQEEDHDSETGR